MEVLYILVPLALALAGLGIVGFIWAVRTGEFDDLESPAHIMMLDDLDSEVNIGDFRKPAAGGKQSEPDFDSANHLH